MFIIYNDIHVLMTSVLKKRIFIVLGTFFAVLGFIGVFLPILPTTPFLLLAAAFYVRSSKRLYNKLINHKMLGMYIKSYVEDKKLPMKAKITTIAMLWISLILSILLLDKTIMTIILLAVGIGVTIHILLIRTLKSEGLIKPAKKAQIIKIRRKK